LKHGYACPIVLARGAQSAAEIASKKEGYDSDLVMGENDHRQCGPGWHDLEVWPPKVRWTKTEAIAYLNLNCRSKLYIEALTHSPGISHPSTIGRVDVNGMTVGRFCLEGGGWRQLEFPLYLPGSPQVAEIKIVVDNPWIPSAISSIPDNRKLGIAVRRIWVD
jgi:hypothetical protein